MEDYKNNVIHLSSHFIRRQYPEELIPDESILAHRPYRDTLLNTERKPQEQDNEKVFLFTTFCLSDHQMRQVVPYLGHPGSKSNNRQIVPEEVSGRLP